jgi:hypothetical protein
MNSDNGHFEKVCQQLRFFVERRKWELTEKEEDRHKRFDIRWRSHSSNVNIYLNGKVIVQGSPTKLKDYLDKWKAAIDAIKNDALLTEQPLPFELETFPTRPTKVSKDSEIVSSQ